ncbi:MAG: type II secretion system F family protein [Lachnospiraceae bacterium]|nr:type II secretion system F family protein [Lachnospiraceae bacterium]
MELVVILSTLAVFFIVVAIFTNYGTTIDTLQRRKNLIDGKGNKQEAIEELNDSFYNRFFAPIVNQLRGNVKKLSEKDGKNKKKTDAEKSAEKLIRLAGFDISVDTYMFYKKTIMLLIISAAIFLALLLPVRGLTAKGLILVVGFAVALLGPNLFLSTAAKNRQLAIKYQLPDALDLLAVCIEAGLSFDASLLKVSEKIEGPFIDELLIVYREIQMGVPRNDALKKLSESSDIPELKTFISALIQANQLGIPINNVMQVQSKTLRETRSQEAREKGAKAPVKMLIPMVVFIFPVLFVILMAPSVINIKSMI